MIWRFAKCYQVEQVTLLLLSIDSWRNLTLQSLELVVEGVSSQWQNDRDADINDLVKPGETANCLFFVK